jgi:hypothetical protein
MERIPVTRNISREINSQPMDMEVNICLCAAYFPGNELLALDS